MRSARDIACGRARIRRLTERTLRIGGERAARQLVDRRELELALRKLVHPGKRGEYLVLSFAGVGVVRHEAWRLVAVAIERPHQIGPRRIELRDRRIDR